MALSDILKKIKKEAEARIKELEKAHESKMQELKDEYVRKQADIKAEIDGKVRTNSQKIMEKTESIAKMESKTALLTAKRAIIESTLTAAIKELAASGEYEKILSDLIRIAKIETGDEGEIISAKGRRDETLKAVQTANSKFKLADNDGDFSGGFKLKSGIVEIDNSFESIIGRELRDSLEPEVARILFQ